MSGAYNPHGAALLDAFRGDTSAMLIVHQNGARDDVPAAFWLRETIDPLEALGLGLCRGRVLDVGAGAGVHTLELQRRGFEVTAFDVSPECVAIMHARGVRDAVVADLYELEAEQFDTIICLCNGLDKVGRLEELPRFLDRMRELLSPGGQLLCDSFEGVGELELQFEYKGERGSPFSVLHVDFGTLARIADEGGWTCEKIDARGTHYLARLRAF